MEEKQNKIDQNYWQILNAAMELDVKKGHLKWTLSDLSRKSGITRSLIYYYFGRSKVDILREAVKMIGTEVTGMTEDRDKMWAEGELTKSMLAAREIYLKAPYICLFLIEHRNRQDEIGQSVRQVEQDFKNKIKRFFPVKDEDQVNSLYAVFWGLLFTPEQNENSYNYVFAKIKEAFSVKDS